MHLQRHLPMARRQRLTLLLRVKHQRLKQLRLPQPRVDP
jgi:hypothetical protein